MRAKLSSGELAVRGDQWPLLVYANQEFDPEDPWNGLFRSRLLIWVGHLTPSPSPFLLLFPTYRHSNIFSLRPALLKRR